MTLSDKQKDWKDKRYNLTPNAYVAANAQGSLKFFKFYNFRNDFQRLYIPLLGNTLVQSKYNKKQSRSHDAVAIKHLLVLAT